MFYLYSFITLFYNQVWAILICNPRSDPSLWTEFMHILCWGCHTPLCTLVPAIASNTSTTAFVLSHSHNFPSNLYRKKINAYTCYLIDIELMKVVCNSPSFHRFNVKLLKLLSVSAVSQAWWFTFFHRWSVLLWAETVLIPLKPNKPFKNNYLKMHYHSRAPR